MYQKKSYGSHTSKVTLGDLVAEEPCYGTSATAIARTDDKQPKYIRITDFDDFGIDDNHEYMTAEKYADKHILKNGDILFARTGATVGKTYYYDGSIGNAVFAGYCIRFRFDEKKVFPKFVYWCTKTSSFINWVNGIQRPSGQPNINKEEYKSYVINLPNIETQTSLSDYLDNALSIKNQKIKKANRMLSDFSSSIMKDLDIEHSSTVSKPLYFAIRLKDLDGVIDVKRYTNTRKKEGTITIADICDIIDLKVNSKTYMQNIVDWIRIDDLSNQPLDIETVRTLPASEIDGSFFEVQENDILVARLGPTILNQKIVMVREIKRTTIASSEFLVLRCKKGYNPEAVMAVLKTAYYRDLMYSHSRGSTPSRYRLNRNDMLKLPFPDISEIQEKIAANALNLRIQVANLRSEAEQEWQEAKKQFEKELLGEL